MYSLNFVQDCRQPFQGGSFFDHEGLPYCETHYHAKRGSLCAGCSKPITGRCITAMFRKFHPEHFVCAFCLKQLNKGTFKEQNDKPYCHGCFDKLFGWKADTMNMCWIIPKEIRKLLSNFKKLYNRYNKTRNIHCFLKNNITIMKFTKLRLTAKKKQN